MRGRVFLAGLCLTLAIGGAAQAQPDTAAADRRAQDLIDNAKQTFSTERPRVRCAKEDPDEIVVCLDRPTDQRVPSTAQTDPNSRAARRFLDGNIPTAPQLDKGYCPSCPKFGSVPPPAYMVDVTALPTAPEGSDADRIAKGEMTAP